MQLHPAIAVSVSVSFTAFIVIMALMPPAQAGPGLIPDKVQHAGAFAVAILPLAMTFKGSLLKPFVMLLGVGILIEILQPWFGRDRSIYDVAADVVGLIIGISAGRLLKRLW